jgi:hypothetical protein
MDGTSKPNLKVEESNLAKLPSTATSVPLISSNDSTGLLSNPSSSVARSKGRKLTKLKGNRRISIKTRGKKVLQFGNVFGEKIRKWSQGVVEENKLKEDPDKRIVLKKLNKDKRLKVGRSKKRR